MQVAPQLSKPQLALSIWNDFVHTDLHTWPLEEYGRYRNSVFDHIIQLKSEMSPIEITEFHRLRGWPAPVEAVKVAVQKTLF